MNANEPIIAYVGHAYRVRKKSSLSGVLWALDALYKDAWEQVQEWDDAGHVASILVKYGAAADHERALELLRGPG